MKNTIILCLLMALGYFAAAQTKWVKKKLFNDIELEFPIEPQQMDFGLNSNWMAFHDSTLFQLSKIKSEDKERTNYKSCNLMLQGILDESKGQLLEKDSIKIDKYCAISFTVQPGVEELEGTRMKGIVFDKDGKSYMLITTSAKSDTNLIDRFISSLKIR